MLLRLFPCEVIRGSYDADHADIMLAAVAQTGCAIQWARCPFPAANAANAEVIAHVDDNNKHYYY